MPLKFKMPLINLPNSCKAQSLLRHHKGQVRTKKEINKSPLVCSAERASLILENKEIFMHVLLY